MRKKERIDFKGHSVIPDIPGMYAVRSISYEGLQDFLDNSQNLVESLNKKFGDSRRKHFFPNPYTYLHRVPQIFVVNINDSMSTDDGGWFPRSRTRRDFKFSDKKGHSILRYLELNSQTKYFWPTVANLKIDDQCGVLLYSLKAQDSDLVGVTDPFKVRKIWVEN